MQSTVILRVVRASGELCLRRTNITEVSLGIAGAEQLHQVKRMIHGFARAPGHQGASQWVRGLPYVAENFKIEIFEARFFAIVPTPFMPTLSDSKHMRPAIPHDQHRSLTMTSHRSWEISEKCLLDTHCSCWELVSTFDFAFCRRENYFQTSIRFFCVFGVHSHMFYDKLTGVTLCFFFEWVGGWWRQVSGRTHVLVFAVSRSPLSLWYVRGKRSVS